MKKINQSPNHVAKLGRSSFDMSKDIKFTSSVGQLLPIYFDYLSYGDKVKIGSTIFSRTKPLATPAMVSIEQKVDYFFVPFKQLYSSFDNLMTNINNFSSNFINTDKVKNGDGLLPFFNWRLVFDILRMNVLRFPETNYGIPALFDFLRMSDLFGLDISAALSYINNNPDCFTAESSAAIPGLPGWSTSTFNPDEKSQFVSLFPWLAYNKIFHDYFELLDFSSLPVDCYNIDNFANDYSHPDHTVDAIFDISDSVNRGSCIHYRPWKKDFFTNIKPSPLVNSVSSLGLNQQLSDSIASLFSTSSAGVTTQSYNGSNNSIPNTVSTVVTAFGNNASSIRAAFAYDKLLRITNFAPKTVDAQIAAHFGWKIPKGLDGNVYYLGSDSSRIDVGEIASTSDTYNGSTGAQLGALAGKGAGFTQGKAKFEFTAPASGILMAIYSAVPTSDYESGVDKLNKYLSINNFYRPEFENLGMQPLYSHQLKGSYNNTSTQASFLGFQYRWSELKQKFNTIHGDFIDTLPDWVVSRNRGSFQFGSNQAAWSWLYSNPNALDGITEVQFSPFVNGSLVSRQVFSRDPLMNWITIHCYKSSTMSMYDLPSL